MALPADNYIISRDTSEAQRLDIQHRMIISCQGYYLHPDISIPSEDGRIAELATGSVAFLRELAPAYPSAEFHGFDISDKMFPGRTELPANIRLHVADIKKPFEARWLGYFDVVHIRLVMAAMRIEDWAPTLRNVITLLKPGGWIQWVEDDRAHSVRHAARAVAPIGTAIPGQISFRPPQVECLARYTRLIMDNERADAKTYGYMILNVLMQDPEVGNLERVSRDVYVIDREDDGGKLRRDWALMGASATFNMLKSREEAGNEAVGMTYEELVKGFVKDVEAGAHYLTRAAVFVGRKRA